MKQEEEERGGYDGLVAYSKHSVHSERVTYWTECLSLCLSVSLKQLCTMLNRNPALQRLLLLSSFSLSGNLFFFSLSTCHAVICLFSLSFLCTLCELPVIVFYFISVLNSFSPGSEYRTLQPSPPPPPLPLPLPPSLSLSLALFLSLFLSLSLPLWGGKTASTAEPQ